MDRSTLGRLGWWLCAELMLILVAGGPSVCARTWVASPDGTTGDGAVATILPQMAHGDSLRLLSGEHEWPYIAIRTGMVLLGDPGGSVVGEGVVFREAPMLTIKGVEFRQLEKGLQIISTPQVSLDRCAYIECGYQLWVVLAERTQVHRSAFVGNTTTSDTDPAALLVSHGDVEIELCTFEGNRSQAGSRWDELESGGGAIRVELETNAVIRECVFLDNVAVSGSAVHSRAMGFVFEDNTVVGNDCEAGAVVAHPSSEDPDGTLIRQNIFADNGAFGLWIGDNFPGVPRVYCNAFWQNNSIMLGDFFAREDSQWRAVAAHGYEGETDYHSTLADPMFCDSLVVHKESELARQDHPCTPIGGARGVGCVVDPTRSTSWGQLKDLLGRE